MEDDFKMVILFGGNEYEIIDDEIKGKIGCIMLPEVVKSCMARDGEKKTVMSRVIKTDT